MKRVNVLYFISVLVFYSCQSPTHKVDTTQDKDSSITLFFGGDILTMEGNEPAYVEALVQEKGKIVFVGTKAEAIQKYGQAVYIDLEGKTLMPGFIDAHSHLCMGADAVNQANINPAPVGAVASIADIVHELQALKTRLKASDTRWLIGTGYDQDYLKEKRHPTCDDLDQYFPKNPVILLHTSGHMLVANSVALKLAKINASTKDPVGGTIVRKPHSKEPNGLCQEMAVLAFMPFISEPISMEKEIEKIEKVQAYYASCGVTTANEGFASEDKLKILEASAKSNKLVLDVIVFPMFSLAKEYVGTNKVNWKVYEQHLKYQGLKMTVDGSPQGKTAFMSKPYLTPVPGCNHDCKGFSNLTQEQVNALFLNCYQNQVQVFSHCNGDASVDMMIKAHEYAITNLKDKNADRRTTIIHSQIMRSDQLLKYKEYGLFPSFFTNHTYYWGDVHITNLGIERASFISPMKSAMDLGIKCTNHTDYTITPMNQLFTVYSAVNRLTRTGKVLGKEQCISAYQALQAITINAAYQYFEEKSKGSLVKGKVADLIVLDQNPLKVESSKIKDVQVLMTYKEGKLLFKK